VGGAEGSEDGFCMCSHLALAFFKLTHLQSYYKIAAELGDADAQMDLAFCLTNGKGCKRDKKEAAKWYREAIKQGQSDVGLAWIYKDKYQ